MPVWSVSSAASPSPQDRARSSTCTSGGPDRPLISRLVPHRTSGYTCGRQETSGPAAGTERALLVSTVATAGSVPPGGHDGDRVSEPDARAVPANLEVERVVVQGSRDDRADRLGVAGVGERARQQALEIGLQAVVGHPGLRQPGPAEELQ